MIAFVNLNSKKNNEISRFLSKYYNTKIEIKYNHWEKSFQNPVEIADFIGVYKDNIEDFEISFWLSLDDGVIVKVDSSNANEIIKYLFERFPY